MAEKTRTSKSKALTVVPTTSPMAVSGEYPSPFKSIVKATSTQIARPTRKDQLQPDGAGKGTIRLFVYGTLKLDHPNHVLLRSKDATFLGYDSMSGPFLMVSAGGFPGVCMDDDRIKGANTIYGELYSVSADTLAACDLLEGHPNWYCRSKWTTDVMDKKSWIYAWPWEAVNRTEPMIYGCWAPKGEEVKAWAKRGVTVRG